MRALLCEKLTTKKHKITITPGNFNIPFSGVDKTTEREMKHEYV